MNKSDEMVLFETADKSISLPVMKRSEECLDSKQVLSVIERYNTALELLDSYDHQRMQRPRGNDD